MGTQGIWSVYENACASIRCRRLAAPVGEQLGGAGLTVWVQRPEVSSVLSALSLVAMQEITERREASYCDCGRLETNTPGQCVRYGNTDEVRIGVVL
jgi:hypothetical protein